MSLRTVGWDTGDKSLEGRPCHFRTAAIRTLSPAGQERTLIPSGRLVEEAQMDVTLPEYQDRFQSQHDDLAEEVASDWLAEAD